MAGREVWLSRHEDKLYFVYSKPGEAPTMKPRQIKSVEQAYRPLRAKGIEILQVGICPPDMIGLEEIEV